MFVYCFVYCFDGIQLIRVNGSFRFYLQSIGGHAAAMGHYFEYARSLKFDEEPDYKYLREMLDDILS